MRILLLFTFLLLGLTSVKSLAQGTFRHTYFLNMEVIGSSPGMADGQIILDLAGDYPYPVEFKITDTYSLEYFVTDTMYNIDYYLQCPLTIITYDVATQDTLVITIINEVDPNFDFTYTLESFMPDFEFMSTGFLSADLSFEPVADNYKYWGTTQEIIYNCPLGAPGDIIDSLYLTNALPGFYYVMITDTALSMCTTFELGNTLSSLSNVEVFTTPSSADSCTGSAFVSVISGGTPPYEYFCDNIQGSAFHDSLCAGIHTLMLIDAASDTVYTMFGITDSLHFIDESGGMGPFSDTVYFQTSDCMIDFDQPIELVQLINIDFLNDSTVLATFGVWQLGIMHTVEDSAYINPLATDNILMDLTNFCLNKATGGNGSVFKYRGALSSLSVSEAVPSLPLIYPNPATDRIQVRAASGSRIVISDMTGKICLQSTANEIDISTIAEGIYIVFVFDDQGVLLGSQKLIKN